MSLGYLHSMRYLAAVFQTASLGGNSAVAETSSGPIWSSGPTPYSGAGEAPVADVAVVADPVHQLPAAEVVVPPPVLVEAAGVEGHHPGGTDPEVVVHLLGRIGVGAIVAGAREVGVAGGEPHLDALHFADVAVQHELDGPAEVGDAPLPGAGLPDPLVLLDGLDHGHALGKGVREGLLAEDVLACLGRLDGGDRVPVVGRGDADRVDVAPPDQFAEVLVGFAVLVVVAIVHLVDGGGQMALVHVGDGHHAAVGQVQKLAEVRPALPADADRAHHDLLRGGLSPEQPAGNQRRRGGRNGCGLQGLPTGNLAIESHGVSLLGKCVGGYIGWRDRLPGRRPASPSGGG